MLNDFFFFTTQQLFRLLCDFIIFNHRGMQSLVHFLRPEVIQHVTVQTLDENDQWTSSFC